MQTITHPPKPGNEYRALQRRNRNLRMNHQQFKPNLSRFNKSQENTRRKAKHNA
jgi:hypothetical protein